MTISEFAIVVFGLTIAGVIKGATGLGYASCALPFLVMVLGLKPAMGLVMLPAMATNVSLAFATGHVRETVYRFRWLYLSMLPGIGVGIWLLTWINQHSAVQFLGLVILGYVIVALARPSMRIPQRLQQPLQWPTGFLNGVVTGLTGAQVMPLFPYVMALHLEPARTVQTINLAVMIASTILVVGLVGAGLVTPALMALSLLAIVPALFGVELGNRARQRIPADAFRRVVLFTLFLVGLLLLLR
jgi:uncharacterized protein